MVKTCVKCSFDVFLLFLIFQEKPKKGGPMSLDEAVDDSENLTDFLMDFEEE